MPEPTVVDPGSVIVFNLQSGNLHVRAYPQEMPESGEVIEFAERRWLVLRVGVRTDGGRPCYEAALLPSTPPTKEEAR